VQCPSTRPLAKSNTDPDQPTLVEIFADAVVDGAATGFALAHLKPSPKPLLWIQDRLTRREAGRPYPAGLPAGLDIIHVDVSKATDVLWSMEEGLRCADLRAETNAVPAWLMRRAAHPNLSAARERWHLKSLPSLRQRYDTRAPGQPIWQADLFRARWRTPGQWVAHHETTTGLHFAHPSATQATTTVAQHA